MHGNVFEWCADQYQAAYPTGNPVVDPTGPTTIPNTRVLRGGSWGNTGTYLRSAARNFDLKDTGNWVSGFRVALTQT